MLIQRLQLPLVPDALRFALPPDPDNERVVLPHTDGVAYREQHRVPAVHVGSMILWVCA